jgi:hypothetical protein
MQEKDKMEEPNRPIIIIGKRGGIENYQLLIKNEALLEDYIPSAYHAKPEYASFLTRVSTEFANKLLDSGVLSIPKIVNGFRVAQSLNGLRIDHLEEIDYHLFEETLKRKIAEVSREPPKPIVIGRSLN